MTQPQDPNPLHQAGISGADAAAQAERVNHALRGYGVPAPQQMRPAASQPKPKGRIKLTSFLIIVGALMVYAVASHFGWYDQLPDLLQP